ncbi:MAG: hypothetical protein H6719_25125 [Sandaracinaceae bacterium]|nr:hypothetical protein [Sandaracinaceae bacterium]
MGETERRARPAPRTLTPWLIVAAVVFFGGQLLPLPGIDHEALAAFAAQGSLLGQLDVMTPALAVIGSTASSLVLVQLVLLVAGALDRPTVRRLGFGLYLVLAFVQGFAIAVWAEAANGTAWMDIVPEPGWGYRIVATLSITAGGALLWWVFSRIDRSRRAHGALFLALLVGVQGAIGVAYRMGVALATGESGLVALSQLALPFALLAVAIALVVRPAAWPVKLFGPVTLGSAWDALAIPAVVGMPFAAIAGGVGVAASAAGQPLGPVVGVGAALTFAVGVGFAAWWLRRPTDPQAVRAWGAPAVGALAALASLTAAFLAFSAAGGIEAALDPGPLAGDASYRIVLEAEDQFVAGDADAMVERLSSLGARATIESRDERRIALHIEGSDDVATVLDALQPRILEMSFTEELDVDPLAGTFGLGPVPSNDYGSGRVRGWRGDCEALEAYLMEPPGDCEPALERSHDSDTGVECTLHCLEAEVILTGADVADARVQSDPQMGMPFVSIELTPEAAAHFGDATGSHVHRVLAILIDGEVVSAPVVQSRIDGGRVQISLGMQSDYDQTLANAAHLATALRPGARISTRFTLVEPAR